MKIVDCVTDSVNKAIKCGKQNSPAILIFFGTVGLVTAGIVACKATPKATQILEEAKKQDEYNEALVSEECLTEDEFKKEHAKLYLKTVGNLAMNYAPAIVMSAVSVICIAESYSINKKRLAALATAYSISETSYRNYRDKVIEALGSKKDEKVRAEIAQDEVDDNPASYHKIIETDTGTTLCYDTLSGRYFHCNVDTIRKAESTLNKRLLVEDYVLLNEFYQEIGIPICDVGDLLGWNVDNMLDISFSSCLSENSEPCLVLEFFVGPRYI